MAIYAGYSFVKSIELLENYKKTLSDKTEIDRIKIRLEAETSLMLKMITELSMIIKAKQFKNNFNMCKMIIESEINKIQNIKTKEDAIEIIDNLSTLKDKQYSDFAPFEAIDEIRAMINNYYSEYEEITQIDAKNIMSAININRDFNIFSARAIKGTSLYFLKDNSNNKATTYALSELKYRDTCKELCDKNIYGELYGSRISNDIFDMMMLVPNISWETSFTQIGGLAEKREKVAFRLHTKYLRKNGIFIYVIPFTRLTNDLSLLIAKTLKNVQVIKAHNTILKQIIIVGTKNPNRIEDKEIYKNLINLKYEDIPNNFQNKYTLPQGGINVPEFFRGSVLDVEELSSTLQNDNLLNNFLIKKSKKEEKHDSRPLLPFTMGQIGLVLASGCLDGVVEEYEGQYHAIKGMVTKVKHNESNNENNEEINIETISNKVQINIVTPDGQFIELA